MKRQRREIVGIVALAAGIVLLRVLWVPRPLILPLPEAHVGASEVRFENRPQGSPHGGGDESGISPPENSGSTSVSLQAFDPNTLDSVGFVRLGFSLAQARTLLKYRSAGGRFRRAEDFAKSYVVSPEMYEKLAPFIRIETDIHGREIHKDAVSQDAAVSSSKSSAERTVHTSDKHTASPSGSASPSSSLTSSSSLSFSSERANRSVSEDAALVLPPRVEINSAGEEALQKLRGIGPYYAQKIVQHRERLGGFVLIEQLLEIEGIDEERLAQFGEQVDIDYEKIRPLSLTDADAKALGAHPYIGPYAARWIVHYRTQFGDSVCRPQVLLRRGIIKEKQAMLLEYYVENL